MSRYSPLTVVTLILFCLIVIPSGSWALTTATPVYLNASTAPSSGVVGVTNVNLTGSGFPSGVIPPGNVTISLATTCGGSAGTTTTALSVKTIIGSSDRIQFQIPASLAKGGYFVSMSGTTLGGTSFQSSNRPSGPGAGTGKCSALAVTAVCGDGAVNQATEQCDPPGAPACPGSLLCKQDCTCPTPPTQSCEETQPTPEQVQAAVLAAFVGLVNPWQNASDFELLLSRTEAELGCVLSANGSVPAPQSFLPQVQGCAAAGVQYCGPGNSQAGTVLPTVACLNEACCQHDRCYAADCVASKCVWTPQSQACDGAPASVIATCDGLGSCGVLDLLHPSAVFICTAARCLNTSFPFDTGTCVDIRTARLLLNPQCLNAATCQCTGQTCATFTTCNPGSACSDPVCGSTAEGGGVCVEGTTPCAGLGDCTNSVDCGGGICFVNTCCGRPVCGSAAIFCPDVGASRPLQVTVPGNGRTIGGGE